MSSSCRRSRRLRTRLNAQFTKTPHRTGNARLNRIIAIRSGHMEVQSRRREVVVEQGRLLYMPFEWLHENQRAVQPLTPLRSSDSVYKPQSCPTVSAQSLHTQTRKCRAGRDRCCLTTQKSRHKLDTPGNFGPQGDSGDGLQNESSPARSAAVRRDRTRQHF